MPIYINTFLAYLDTQIKRLHIVSSKDILPASASHQAADTSAQ